MKNAVFLDVTLCGSCKNRRFGGTYRLKYRRARNNVSSNNRITLRVNSKPVLEGVGTRGSVVGSDTTLLAGRTRVRFPQTSRDFQSIHPFSRIMALVLTRNQTEMGTEIFLGIKRDR
jgi:hypothetical protein